MNSLLRDVQYGLRGLRQQPVFALLAILALALGIGAATTMFSVIDGILLNPFPYKDAHRIATFYIHDSTRSGRGGRSFFPVVQWLEYQKRNHVFEDAIGAADDDVRYDAPDGAEQYQGAWVTVNTFRFLGVPPLLGRGIVPEDGGPGATPVCVMAFKMWNKRFNRDTSILGRTFVLNGVPTTLVGVMPARFTKRDADLYLPLSLDPADPLNKGRYVLFQARMKPGITLKDIESDIGGIAHQLAKTYPREYPERFVVQADSYADSVVGQFKTTLLTLASAVGLLLLIACGNVANMLLARATAREKEMAVRAALGAGRWRVVRQLLIESLLLAIGGAAAGCLLSYAGIQGLLMVIPESSIPHEAVIQINLPVLLFSLGTAVLTALLFGLAPAVQAVRREIADPLRDSGKGVSGGFRQGKLRNALVVGEVSLSLILLVGAGLLMRSFIALTSIDLGFRPENVLAARLPFPPGQYKTPESKQQFFRKLLPRLQSTPGITAAAATTSIPPFGGIRSEIEVPGKTHSERWNAVLTLCTEAYSPTLGLQLKRGRFLNQADLEGRRQTAVVNETLVKRYFAAEDAIGRQIQLKVLASAPESPVQNTLFEIVGVVVDICNQGIREATWPEVLIPSSVTSAYDRWLFVRTSRFPMAQLNTLRREIWTVDRNMALTFEGTLDSFVQRFTMAGPRFGMILLGVFAGVGLVLVTIGVFSVIAYTVSRQTHEIGIRIALGADRRHVVRLVLAMGLRLVGVGIVIGLAASFALSRLLANQIWGISLYDPLTIAGVTALVTVTGMAASYFPARRATQVDPIVALRYE